MRGMTYLPISGTIIGIIVSSFYDISSLTLSLPLTIASIISEVASLWVTGCFHEDGLADSADGIGGGWTTEQILKIMMDTRLGTFGCAILLLYIVGKLELIAILGSSVWGVGICEGGGPAIIVTCVSLLNCCQFIAFVMSLSNFLCLVAYYRPCIVRSQTLARLVAPMLIKTRDYVDEGGPKYQFYSFFLEAKHLVTWSRVLFATLASLAVSSIAYGLAKGATLIIVVTVIAFFSGRYGDYILG